MRVPRIFADLTPGDKSGSAFALSAADYNHLIKVLRLTPGRKVTVVDSCSQEEYEAEIESSSFPGQARIIKATGRKVPESAVDALIFSLCRGKQTELVLEKATELGVQQIWLVQSERSTIRLDEELSQKLSRWNRIIETAAKQCRRVSMPELRVFRSTKECAEAASENVGNSKSYLLSPDADAPLITKLQPPAAKAHLFIGPEGGLSPDEVRLLLEHGFKQVRIGANVLKAETAAIAAIALAQALWSK